MGAGSEARFVLESLDDGRRIALPDSQLVVLGRGWDCDLAFDDDSAVSRFHCCVTPLESGDGLLVRDLGSRNGTFINGESLQPEGVLRLHETLQVGQHQFRLALCEPSAEEAVIAPTVTIHAPMPAKETTLAAPIPPRPLWLRPSRPWWLKARGTAHPEMPEPSPPVESITESTVEPQAPPVERLFQNPLPRPRGRGQGEGAEPGNRPPHPQPLSPEDGGEGSFETASEPHTAPVFQPAVESTEWPRLAPISEEMETSPTFIHDETRTPQPVEPAAAKSVTEAPKLPEKPNKKMVASAAPVKEPSLAELVAMERKAKPVRRPTAAAARPASESRELPLGYWSPVRAGQRWNSTRAALQRLSLVSLAATVLLNIITGTIVLKAVAVLAKNGLSVFIPFEAGGRVYSGSELVEIGTALTLVAATPVVLLQITSRFAEELFAVVLWGLGASVLPAMAFGANPAVGNFLAGTAAILFSVWALAAAVFVAQCVLAPVEMTEQIGAGAAVALFVGGAVFLLLCLRLDVTNLPTLDVPLFTPPIAAPLAVAVLCGLLGILGLCLPLRAIAERYGDEPTKATINGYLIYHIAAIVLSLVGVAAINSGADHGWGSAFLGLLALVLLYADFVVFVQMVRNACHTLR